MMQLPFKSKVRAAHSAALAVAFIALAGCAPPENVVMHARALPTAGPISGALLVLTRVKRPFFGSLFSSADPSQCVSLGFAKTDATGRFPVIKGSFPSALIASGFTGLSQLDVVHEARGFVLRQQRLQGGEDAMQFGPEYSVQADANRARLAFLASAEGQNYTAFTIQPAQSGFKNYRSLVVKYVEVARSAPFSTQSEADAAYQSNAFAVRGEFDASAVLDVLARCQGARVNQPELGIAVLRAIETALPQTLRTPTQSDYLRQFAEQVSTAPN
jgi:hypothetical protein